MRRDGRNFRIAPTLMFFTPTPEQVKDLQAQNYLPQGGSATTSRPRWSLTTRSGACPTTAWRRAGSGRSRRTL